MTTPTTALVAFNAGTDLGWRHVNPIEIKVERGVLGAPPRLTIRFASLADLEDFTAREYPKNGKVHPKRTFGAHRQSVYTRTEATGTGEDGHTYLGQYYDFGGAK